MQKSIPGILEQVLFLDFIKNLLPNTHIQELMRLFYLNSALQCVTSDYQIPNADDRYGVNISLIEHPIL